MRISCNYTFVRVRLKNIWKQISIPLGLETSLKLLVGRSYIKLDHFSITVQRAPAPASQLLAYDQIHLTERPTK
ncbi:hypothetical protein VNO80_10705 [Phaseolus coccineus]|uniref:Uncharacterized protein n=1 Tax=Phaseolus coccineus TaxID=3886 RepID=A0AAN9NDX0_PHACN